MNPNTYDVGTRVTMTGTFKDRNGNLVDPSVVTAMISPPDREVVDLTGNVSNVSPGVYAVTHVATMPGGYRYQMEGSGNCQVARYGSFNAQELF